MIDKMELLKEYQERYINMIQDNRRREAQEAKEDEIVIGLMREQGVANRRQIKFDYTYKRMPHHSAAKIKRYRMMMVELMRELEAFAC